MSITDLITDCRLLTTEVIQQAYSSIVRMIKLQPMTITVSCNAIKLLDLTGQSFNVIKVREDYADLEFPVKIKEITDIICSERLSEIPEQNDIYEPADIEMKLGVTDNVSGSVYYSNNMISTTSNAVFILLCYCMPEMLSEELIGEDDEPYTEYYVPDHLVMLTLAKALSISSENAGDIEQSTRYEAVVTQLVNAYNLNMIENLPNSLIQGFTLSPYEL